jgi:hypothetical protein
LSLRQRGALFFMCTVCPRYARTNGTQRRLARSVLPQAKDDRPRWITLHGLENGDRWFRRHDTGVALQPDLGDDLGIMAISIS